MTMLALGLVFGALTLILMFSGAPISFALGSVAVLFMYLFMPASALVRAPGRGLDPATALAKVPPP